MSDTKPAGGGTDTSLGVRHLTPPFRRGHQIYYTPAEWEAVVEAARACGRPAAVFVRETSLGAIPAITATAPLLRELCRNGMALTQLAATAKATGALPHLERVETALSELLAIARGLDASRPRGRHP